MSTDTAFIENDHEQIKKLNPGQMFIHDNTRYIKTDHKYSGPDYNVLCMSDFRLE